MFIFNTEIGLQKQQTKTCPARPAIGEASRESNQTGVTVPQESVISVDQKGVCADIKTDIGQFINYTMTTEDIYQALEKMEKGQIYYILQNHDQTSKHLYIKATIGLHAQWF